MTSTLLRPIIDGDPADLEKIEVNGKDQWLLFPARLYCGQSLLDSRRESIIIDYAFTDELPGYRERPDFLAGRRGFQVRDEIRMVRPGFYLGRAYLGRIFLLNFTLYNKEIADRERRGICRRPARQKRTVGRNPEPQGGRSGEVIRLRFPLGGRLQSFETCDERADNEGFRRVRGFGRADRLAGWSPNA